MVREVWLDLESLKHNIKYTGEKHELVDEVITLRKNNYINIIYM